MKPKQATQTCALSSTASEARFLNLERHGPPERSQPKYRRPLARSRPPTAPKRKNEAVANPVFSSPFASQTTRAPTRWRLRSEVRSLDSRRCWPRGVLGPHQPTQEIPSAIASHPELAKRVCRWPRRSGEEALRPSPRWLPTGVSWPCVRYSNLEHKQAFPR